MEIFSIPRIEGKNVTFLSYKKYRLFVQILNPLDPIEYSLNIYMIINISLGVFIVCFGYPPVYTYLTKIIVFVFST